MRRFAVFLGLLVALLLASAAGAARFPDTPDSYVTDPAGLLAEPVRDEMRARLDRFRRETGVQLTVLLLPDWRPYADPGQSVEDWTTALFNHWGVGAANRNDGILILVSPGDRVVRLALGSGYEPGYDAVAAQVVQDAFLPKFRSGDLAGGLTAGLDATMAEIGRPHSEGLPPPAPPPRPLLERLFPWLFGAFAAFILFKGFLATVIGDWAYRFTPCPQCGQRGMHRAHVGPQEAAGSAAAPATPGVGRIVTTCPHCGYRSERPWVVPSSGSDSSSGPGFGGGHSSGGGATGRW